MLVSGAVDLALAAGAEGVHLDASDLPVAIARRLLGPAAIIGATTQSPQDAVIAQTDGATFVMVDRVYENGSRAPGALVGADGLARVRAVCSLPICACGGITPERVGEVVAQGAELIGLRADAGAQSPADVAASIRSLAAAFPPLPHVAP
jgi:thiamine-phosphate diphosphorylase